MMTNQVEHGASARYKGQIYYCEGPRPYTRKDGIVSELREWRTECAVCGEVFVFSTSATAKAISPNRRCKAHAKPGITV
jgi:5-methylcytosine-specific restriction endonuclease McrA